MSNDKPMFNVGDYVHQGDLIGRVGNTGQSSGAHLHYDISDEVGLSGSAGKGEQFINEHYADPNAYLGTYFKNQGYKGNVIYSQNNSSSGSSEAKGGEYTDLGDMYELILKVIEYLSKITTNTGLIGEIVTLLTQIDEINSNPSLTPSQRTEQTMRVRRNLADRAQEYSRTLNSANNEMTGHQAMVKSMQVIAAN